MSGLEQILDGEEQVDAVAPQEPVAEAEVAEASEPKPTEGEEVKDEPPASVEGSGTVPVSALLDERRKRQELEQRLAAKEEKTERPDIFDDQEAFAASILDQFRQEQAAKDAEKVNDIANQSEAKYRKDVGDAAFEETYAKFAQLAEGNPKLVEQARSAADPYKVVFDTVAKAAKLARLENVDDIEAQIRADLTETIRAELTEELKAQSQKTSNISPSLANTPASGSVGANSWTGPTPLESVFGED